MKFDFCMSRDEYDDLVFSLTDDEREVLDMRRHGRRNAEIAAEMNCCERTVNRYVKNIKNKMYNMKNEDGSFGAHWDLEQTRVYMESRGVDCEVWKWAAVMNMMYSDYCKAARKNSVDRPEFYADLAAAFLEDKDASEDKAGRYYHNIAAVQE